MILLLSSLVVATQMQDGTDVLNVGQDWGYEEMNDTTDTLTVSQLPYVRTSYTPAVVVPGNGGGAPNHDDEVVIVIPSYDDVKDTLTQNPATMRWIGASFFFLLAFGLLWFFLYKRKKKEKKKE